MGRRLFGTDGVRGVAGIEITGQLALALGRAAVNHSGLDAPRALVIRDTRESGEMLEAALAAGSPPPAARSRSAACCRRRLRRC